MIKVLCFEKDGSELLREIDPVLCKDGLALQKCNKDLYALIHVQSGWTLKIWSMTAKMAEEWFNAASDMMDWNCSVKQIKIDPRVISALKIGKELEEKFLFPPEKKKEETHAHTS